MLQVKYIETLEDDVYLLREAKAFFDGLSTKSALALDTLRCEITEARQRGKETPRVRCAFCRNAVYMRRNSGFEERGFHFVHFAVDTSPVSCPQFHQGPAIRDMRALLHNGVQEGQLHLSMKMLIRDLLQADALVRPGTVLMERRLAAGTEYRKPDVQAVYAGALTAFEVQVSRELPGMIAARQYFYERHDHRILWILPTFSPNEVRQSLLDIAISNNNHLFVLDGEMSALSAATGQLHLTAWYQWPRLEAGRIEYLWQSQQVPVSEIHFRNGHAFVVDVPTELKRLQAIQAEEERAARVAEAVRAGQAVAGHEPLMSARPRAPAYVRDALSHWRRFDTDWRAFARDFGKAQLNHWAAERLQEEFSKKEGENGLCVEWLRLQGVPYDAVSRPDIISKLVASILDGRLRWESQSWKWAYNLIAQSHTRWEKAMFFLAEVHCRKTVNPFARDFGQAWYGAKREELLNRPTQLHPFEQRLLAILVPQHQANYLKGIETPDVFHAVKPDLYGYFVAPTKEGTWLIVPELYSVNSKCEPQYFVPDDHFRRMIDNVFKNDRFLPMPGLRSWSAKGAETTERFGIKALNARRLGFAVECWQKQIDEMRRELRRVLRQT